MLSKLIAGIFTAALILIGGLLAFSFLPLTGNYTVKIVQSGSMEPEIKTGALVVVKPASDYAVGDVITFTFSARDEIPTTHRIVAERAVSGVMQYTVKGDANEEADPKEVLEKDVIGKVIFSVPYLGFLLDFARKPLGFTLLIVVPAGAIIIEEALKIWTEISALRRKKVLRQAQDLQKGKERSDTDVDPHNVSQT
ncbi:signal peptidase I [Candidatus Kaiserbacteria bacterium RIFCSPHIGHO2_01_FULL_48_10]|uniref:Signal peptidase I n=1 Tax=Candidatus Kaiserbacteria bacterium RIFCSPHIGHO2_01_FULL_48_10 TaxID=1798476 RepID=A0A1F6C5H1_9BACT|nr:MAG: signal peptidase I [Candidatus Kaiserbacteria bacterium RIFCSPHIGHO2_01_FULL_48_10]